jgi:hypothetical protein
MQVLAGVNYGSYSFNASTGVITLSNLPSPLEPEQLKLVINTTSNTIIFNLADPTKTATVTGGNTITLTYNTSAMNNSDPLQIFLEVPGNQYVDNASVASPTGTMIMGQYAGTAQAIQTDASGNLITSSLDGTVLDTQTSITTTGPGNTYNTKGYGFLAFQFGGIWAGVIRVEGSNDGVAWTQQYVQHLASGLVTDIITLPNITLVEAASVYMRYYVVQLETGTITATVVGNTGTIPTTNLLAMSFDSSSGVQQNVNVANLKLDTTSALVLSDAPAPILISGGVGQVVIIDTIGYQSLNVTTETLTATTFSSNDKVTWSALSCAPLALGSLVTSIAANTGYTLPCVARYIRFTITAAGTATAYLRNQPWPAPYATPTGNASTNIAQFGGVAQLNGGVGGSQAVGGTVAVGSAPTANPILIGTVDPSNLTRRVQSDTTGRLNVNILSTDQTGTVRVTGSVSPPSNMQNLAALAVQELSQFEGQSFIELLAQILIELRISNYYHYNLPTLLTTGLTNSTGDEPSALRNDPVITTVFG